MFHSGHPLLLCNEANQRGRQFYEKQRCTLDPSANERWRPESEALVEVRSSKSLREEEHLVQNDVVRAERGTVMIRGGCLCGGVRFEIDRAAGPFELCHCRRCRKVSGSAFMAGIGVRRSELRLTSGHELIRAYEAPIVESPPAYRVCFCSRCGSCVPDPEADGDCIEIAAGRLDDDPGLRPDKHIFVELKAPWFDITDDLPRLDKKALIEHRRRLQRIIPTSSS